MPDTHGHIELERTIDSIVIGGRHRTELGDLGPLMRSIEKVGVLQPVTITPDGMLVCGRRRLEAMKRLGWHTLKVWVRSGISDELSLLLAQRDENEQRKPLSPLEGAELYAELKKLLAEDATRRQMASRFGAEADLGGKSGAADSAAPERGKGDTRRQAAEFVSGKAGYERLEQVNAIKRNAADVALPKAVRDLAAAALAAIECGADVYPLFEKVRVAIQLAAEDPQSTPLSSDDLETLASDAVARIKQERARGGGRVRARRKDDRPTRRTLRSFILTWADLDGWSAHYDAEEVGVKLGDKEWETFERVLRETTAFAEAVRMARQRDREPVSA